MKRKVMVAAGGTGGHIYPAISIIEYLTESGSVDEILFAGTSSGMERTFTREQHIRFISVKASGFSAPGGAVRKIKVFVKFLFNLISGFITSLKVIKKYRPDIVLGMGGYVCAPVLLAAIFLKKKIALHEQNYLPGRLNRYFAGFSRFVFLSFKESEKYFKPKKHGRKIPEIIYTGNPVRKSVLGFASLAPDYDRWNLEKSRKTIVAFGGSLGAGKLNDCILSLYELLRNDSKYQIILICGNRYYDELDKRLQDLACRQDRLIFRLFPYIDEMEQIYRIADIVISRAGATTVAELGYTRIPAILIPYPEAVENHQFFNADYLARKNMASIILDGDLSPDVLLIEIKKITSAFRKKNIGEISIHEDDKIIKYQKGHEIINAAAIISDKITGDL